MQANVHRYDEENHSGSVLLDDGREIPFGGDVLEASGLRHLRPGQRVSIDMSASLSADFRRERQPLARQTHGNGRRQPAPTVPWCVAGQAFLALFFTAALAGAAFFAAALAGAAFFAGAFVGAAFFTAALAGAVFAGAAFFTAAFAGAACFTASFAGTTFFAATFAGAVFLAAATLTGAAFFTAALAGAAFLATPWPAEARVPAAARAPAGVVFGSVRGSATLVLNAVPALNFGTTVFLILTLSPVRGLRPIRAARATRWKVPKPVMPTLPPPVATSRMMTLTTASRASAACFLLPSFFSSSSISCPPEENVRRTVARRG